jgi:Gluconate 2-dehydrogenase subunit 3
MNPQSPARIDRRLAIKWMMAAGAGALLAHPLSFGADTAPSGADAAAAKGYGSDPDLMKPYKAGDLWPLTFTEAQRRDVAALCDVIIPADSQSASASALGVTDFIDEWVSAPYDANVADKKIIMEGLSWLSAESQRRYGGPFAGASDAQRLEISEEMSLKAPENSQLEGPSRFFRRFRNLTATGFYTTPVGMKDIGYVGNLPLAKFEGPPADVVAKLGLTDEVKW